LREDIFLLVYAGQFTRADVMAMTSDERLWHLKRLHKQKEAEADAMKQH
jgi:hypothetical protein